MHILIDDKMEIEFVDFNDLMEEFKEK